MTRAPTAAITRAAMSAGVALGAYQWLLRPRLLRSGATSERRAETPPGASG